MIRLANEIIVRDRAHLVALIGQAACICCRVCHASACASYLDCIQQEIPIIGFIDSIKPIAFGFVATQTIGRFVADQIRGRTAVEGQGFSGFPLRSNLCLC